MEPTAPDFGSEADLISTADEEVPAAKSKKWAYSLRGFLRAPARVGLGPRNDGRIGHELHGPPRMTGATSNEWNYIGLAPGPSVSLYATVGNPRVTGNLILAANTLYDSGYKNLDQQGGISQAYVTMRFPDLFPGRGGLSWNVGAFSNRYGTAGPSQNSSGYYGTYLFGRTHVAGETLTADIELSDDLNLIVEDGLGAKLEVITYVIPVPGNTSMPATPPTAPYLPSQGPVPQGSNFLHHAHAALLYSDWLRITGHYMTSWTPNDNRFTTAAASPVGPDGKMTIFGGEVHADGKAGSLYVGYSNIKATQILSLSDGVQVIHGSGGAGFKQNYFRPLPPGWSETSPEPRDDSGTVQTVLFQYILKLAPLMGYPARGRDLSLALYSMFNHIEGDNFSVPLKLDRIKFGAEAMVSPIRFLSAGLRFDRAQPNGTDSTYSYSAISPRVIVHTNWLSREYVIINYSHYFLGSNTRPSSPYEMITRPDPDLFMVSAVMSF
jgi:hypothetical protein